MIPDQLLNGTWLCGIDRIYDRETEVPGLPFDPRDDTAGSLWYKRELLLPGGSWDRAELVLGGARFCPSVFVDGDMVSEAEGGMAPTVHSLTHPAVRPGARITLEIALCSRCDMDPANASRITDNDAWRTNIASCLWDDVTLRFSRGAGFARVLADARHDSTLVPVRFTLTGPAEGARVRARITGSGETAAEAECDAAEGALTLDHEGRCVCWSPEVPACYTLTLELMCDGEILARYEQLLGVRTFEIQGRGFALNGRPVTLRMGTFVWHRFCRDPEGRQLAFDDEWFYNHVIVKLKERGANALRFHLGTPPERLLEQCDRAGLLVQAEWHFFHRVDASFESMVSQWRNWLDLCARHPSVCVIHPWNEVDEELCREGYRAVETLRSEYPPLVVSHRDVTHLHPYWWSLFENLGLYYDSPAEFDRPVIADEFGGNYLDGDYRYGLYPTVREAYTRFLGRRSTSAERIALHTDSAARVAEYWRRLGVAGFSPFCIAGSPEDGSHYYEGPLADGKPKPVWDALTAAYSPVSVSAEIWDRHFVCGDRAVFMLHLFNDTDDQRVLNIAYGVDRREEYIVTRMLPAFSSLREQVSVRLPDKPGRYTVFAELQNPPECVKRRVFSGWRVTVTEPPAALLSGLTLGIYRADEELRRFAERRGAKTVPPSMRCDAVVLGRRGLAQPGAAAAIEKACARDTAVLLTDFSHRELPLPGGFTAYAEPAKEGESCIHPTPAGKELWAGLPRDGTQLWNGLRGGLIVPAETLRVRAPQDGRIVPLSEAGRKLALHPVVLCRRGSARILVSQALTEGRLDPDLPPQTGYIPRYDPAAERFLMNMILFMND